MYEDRKRAYKISAIFLFFLFIILLFIMIVQSLSNFAPSFSQSYKKFAYLKSSQLLYFLREIIFKIWVVKQCKLNETNTKQTKQRNRKLRKKMKTTRNIAKRKILSNITSFSPTCIIGLDCKVFFPFLYKKVFEKNLIIHLVLFQLGRFWWTTSM